MSFVQRMAEVRRKRKHCFHHDRPAWAKGEVDSRSYVRERIIDVGARKLYECMESEGGCGHVWIL